MLYVWINGFVAGTLGGMLRSGADVVLVGLGVVMIIGTTLLVYKMITIRKSESR
jgi:hypothetical protein